MVVRKPHSYNSAHWEFLSVIYFCQTMHETKCTREAIKCNTDQTVIFHHHQKDGPQNKTENNFCDKKGTWFNLHPIGKRGLLAQVGKIRSKSDSYYRRSYELLLHTLLSVRSDTCAAGWKAASTNFWQMHPHKVQLWEVGRRRHLARRRSGYSWCSDHVWSKGLISAVTGWRGSSHVGGDLLARQHPLRQHRVTF